MNRTKNTKKAENLAAVHTHTHTHTHVIYGNKKTLFNKVLLIIHKKIKEDRSIMPVAIVDTG